jgi:hypothetical protein
MLIDCDRETYGKFIRNIYRNLRDAVDDKATTASTLSVMQTMLNGKLVAQAIYNHGLSPRYQVDKCLVDFIV